VETVTGKLAGTLWWSLAAQDRQTALLAADSRSTSSGSRDIVVYQRAAGGWSPARSLAQGGLNTAPRVAYTPEGQPVLAWYRDQSISGLVGDLGAAPTTWFTTTLDSAAALGGGWLLAGSAGQMALVWPGSTPVGPDVWLARYDPSMRAWAAPSPVFGDALEDADLSAAMRADGALVLGL
jgi:hypothetical protein